MEDTAIVELFFARSERAIAETDKKYGRYCYNIAHRILENRQDSEESVSDAYLSAWNAIPPSRPRVLATFLGKIVRRIAIDRWRWNTSQKRGGGAVALALEELEDCVAAPETPESRVEAGELAALVRAFVAELPDWERRVFVCRYWYLDPVQDIAQRFGFSEGKVHTMLRRTRLKLRSRLQQEGWL